MIQKNRSFISKAVAALMFILSCITCHAQMSLAGMASPITWKATAAMTGADSGVITITADIAGGWHLYGMEMPADGPKATAFTFNLPAGITLAGKTVADKAPLKKNDPMFGTEVTFWEGKVKFTQKFRLQPGKKAGEITVSVSYMGCNDQTCLPPKKQDLRIAVKPLKKSTAK